MRNKIKKLSLIIVLIPLIAVSFLFLEKNNFKILETSVLSILQNIAEENAPAPSDLGIDKITIRKLSDPTDDFKYYKYTSTIILHNYGGNLTDDRVILSAGKDQKYTLVRNTDDGFSLSKDETYIVRNYEFIFDGKYNGGTLPIKVEIIDGTDSYEENNTYEIDVFDPSAKIESISLKEILNDGTFVLDFNSIPFSIRKHNFELFTSDSAIYSEEDVRYHEVYTLDQVYGYYRIKNSLENVKSEYTSSVVTELDSHFVTFTYDPFLDDTVHYVYVKATNPETGNYAISNVLMLPPQENMDRAEFAKLFVDLTGEKIVNGGVNYFEDVSNDQWYYPYVQTLYNLGLLNTETYFYNPDALISRGEVLRVALDYFDVDLTVDENDLKFEDISEDNRLYPYIDALLSTSAGSSFHEYFNSDAPATKNYLKYLINEYSKSN